MQQESSSALGPMIAILVHPITSAPAGHRRTTHFWGSSPFEVYCQVYASSVSDSPAFATGSTLEVERTSVLTRLAILPAYSVMSGESCPFC